MKYADIKKSVLAQFAMPNGHKVVPFIIGRPGGGKSSCARDIAAELCRIHNIPSERVIEFNPSLREPSDILGLPDLSGDYSRWVPAAEFYQIRKGTGPSVLIIEELSDASMDMMNAMCRIILDRHAGMLPLSEELYIIASGNRTEDRSGASRLSTKLANRMRTLKFDENLEDWVAWASENGIDPTIMAFLTWKPNLLSDFDPSRSCNPTPRSWEDVSRIPVTLSKSVYREHVEGAVGEGAAAEYIGFRAIVDNLPDFDAIVDNPKKAEVPGDVSTLYALCCRISQAVTPDTMPAYMTYIERLAPEFVVMTLRIIGRDKTKAKCRDTSAYTKLAVKHAKLIIGC